MLFKKPIFARLNMMEFIDPVELQENHIIPLDGILKKLRVGYVSGNEYDFMGNTNIVIYIKTPNRKNLNLLLEVFQGIGQRGLISEKSLLVIGDKIHKLQN